jgi:hypothetical protein
MKHRIALVALPIALAGLGACSTYDSYGYGYGYDDYGYGSGYSNGYGSGYGYGTNYGYGPSSTLIWHDAYYDNFYGPVFGGYWDLDGYFWYQSRSSGPYVRDHARHFRRDNFSGGRHHRYQDNRNNHNTYPPLFSGQKNDHDGRNGYRGSDDRSPRGGPSGQQSRGRDDDRGRGSPPALFGSQPPRATPTPPPQRGRNDDRGRGGDRGGNADQGRNNPPALFGGSQAPRVTPTPPPQQPRGRDGDRGRNNPPALAGGQGDGRGRGGDDRRGPPRGQVQSNPTPPAPLATPPQQPRSSSPPPQQQSRSTRGDSDNSGDRSRGRGGNNRRDRD